MKPGSEVSVSHAPRPKLVIDWRFIAIRRAGHPLESGEVVEEFRKIGHPIGGTHEIKTAYNRLSEAKKVGVLTHIKGVGYWIVGHRLPQTALDGVAAVRAARRKSRGKDSSRARGRGGGRHGASDALSSGEKEAARKMLLSGKSVHEVAAHFDVSDATMRRYLHDDLETLREVNGGRLPQRRIRRSLKSNGPRKITKRLGRRSSLSDEQVTTIISMRSAGKSVETIAGEFGVSVDVVYRRLRDHKAGKS